MNSRVWTVTFEAKTKRLWGDSRPNLCVRANNAPDAIKRASSIAKRKIGYPVRVVSVEMSLELDD